MGERKTKTKKKDNTKRKKMTTEAKCAIAMTCAISRLKMASVDIGWEHFKIKAHSKVKKNKN